MTEFPTIPDAQIRDLAVTTFDRNVVVVAGAGTGKTTLLVNRIVHALMREPGGARITEVVALTFTNKAASEMKMRLREQLTDLVRSLRTQNEEKSSGTVSMEQIRQYYRLTSEQVADRARAALLDLEKAQIGTVHSFAAHLLRLHPIESGIDPLFQEDDGSQFDHFFNQEWEVWLDGEMGPHGSHHAIWQPMLSDLSLEDIQQLAFVLCNEITNLEELQNQVEAIRPQDYLQEWVRAQRSKVTALIAQYGSARKRNIDSALIMAQDVFEWVFDPDREPPDHVKTQVAQKLTVQLGKPPTGWDTQDFLEARRLISLSTALVAVDHRRIGEWLQLLLPFVRKVRKGFSDEGLVTFDGLLARANRLLREHSSVRERLKSEYKTILVDEFQDTDPLQYEIILYLAEQLGSRTRTWKEVDLTPGKLFIVGDPKQSIYAFRRADLEAYDQVVQKIKHTGGLVLELSTNFRSHEKVLTTINAIFGKVLQPVPNVQPGNVSLVTQPERKGGITQPGVELHVAKTDGESEEPFDSAAATRVEAEQLARWIKEELLPNTKLTDDQGRHIPLQPGHIGLLLRKLTQARDYLDALRRYGIPYVTDGEKHFYRRQEVIDFINLLRVIENPSDTVAFIGVLRSPLGALTDQEVYELHQHQALDYRREHALQNWTSPRVGGTRRLYTVLAQLGRLAFTRSIPEIIDAVFTQLPVLELGGASLHQEQAVANLLKFRDLAEQVVARPHVSFNGFIDLLIERVSGLQAESEGGVTEETLDAIRVLTIHKAKGLEFPVVILPGLHHGTNFGTGGSQVLQDWVTGTLGLSVGKHGTVGSVVIRDKLRMKEEAEQNRVLYVAMTRAKERVILSCGVPDRLPRGSFLGVLDKVADVPLGSSEYTEIPIGECVVPQRVTKQASHPTGQKPKGLPPPLKDPPSLDRIWHQWELRDQRWKAAKEQRPYLTPTSLSKLDEQGAGLLRSGSFSIPQGNLIGTIAHQILEAWDFAGGMDQFHTLLAGIFQSGRYPDLAKNIDEYQRQLFEIFHAFYQSDPYKTIHRSTIVGREIPFEISWDCSKPLNQDIKNPICVMEGVIDLVYTLEGRWWIADYKTDHLKEDPPNDHLGRYQTQARIYRDAAARCLGLTQVGCQLIFIRHGLSVEI